MKRPPLPYLLLLPLLAVLLFGNCGGGVYGMLVNNPNQQRMRALLVLRLDQRAAARKQLHGAARHEAYRRIEQDINARLDSLMPPSSVVKFHKRRNKVERRLMALPVVAPTPQRGNR